MKLSDRMKAEAEGNRTKVQTKDSMDLEVLFNNLFYLPKRIEEETAFIKSVMTRGAVSQERIGLHASAVLETEKNFCYRAQLLSLFYHQAQGENVEPSLKRIFEEGNAIHEKWQRLFIRAGWATWKDLDYTRMEKQYDLSYTPDAIIRIPKEKGSILGSDKYCGEYVVEIKSVNTFQFQKMKTGKSRHAKGEMQCKLYNYLTGIQKGIVLCEDKNTQEFLCILVDRDKSVIQPYIDRLEKIQYYKHRFVAYNKVPLKHKEADSPDCKICSKCNMCGACWGIKEGRKRLENV